MAFRRHVALFVQKSFFFTFNYIGYLNQPHFFLFCFLTYKLFVHTIILFYKVLSVLSLAFQPRVKGSTSSISTSDEYKSSV